MRLSRTTRPRAVIPTAALADLALLLTIFFLLAAGRSVDRTRIDLPTSRIRREAPAGAARVALAWRVGPDGEKRLVYEFSDGKATRAEVGGVRDVYFEAARLSYVAPATRFVLEAGATVRYERVDELLDALREAGVSNVVLRTAQEPIEVAP